MHRKLLTLLICLLGISVMGQLTNNGATIVIESGATLYVEGNVENLTGGIITNNGVLEVQGNIVHDGSTFSFPSGSKLILSGSTATDISGFALSVDDLDINKSSANITLSTPLTVDGVMNFLGTNNGKFVLGSNKLSFTTNGSITGASASTGHIDASSTGIVEKSVTGNGSFKFEIGDATNYTPIDLTFTGSGYTSAKINANLTTGSAHPNKPADADDYITRVWNVTTSGISNFSSTATANYVVGDVSGGMDASVIKGAAYDGSQPLGSQWSWKSSGGNGSNEISGIIEGTEDEFTGMNFFGRTNLKVFLAGAYIGGGTMSTNLNTSGILETHALTSPYDPTVSVASGFFASNPNIVDWIELETRDPNSPSAVISTHSAFLLNDGSIIGIDGGSILPRLKDSPTAGIIGVNHRNHLGIRMVNGNSIALDLVSPSLHDFSTGLDKAYNNTSITANSSMKNSSGVFILWSGNANGNSNVRYFGPGNDNSAILNALGGVSGNVMFNIYSSADINMNGNVRYFGPANDNSALLTAIDGTAGNVFTQHK